MLRPLLLCSLALFFCTRALAQNIDPRYNHVIAAGGLNLRAQPSTSGAVITAIPFGAQVNIFDYCDYGIDTIGYLQDYYSVHDHATETEEYRDQAIVGRWARVAYGTDTGYVFNAYLWYNFSYAEPSAQDSDYVIITPNGGCGGEVHDPFAYHYYGVYASEAGSTDLRPINISYLAVVDDLEALLITTGQPRDLRFIIGSKRELPPTASAAAHFQHPVHLFAVDPDTKDTLTNGAFPELTFDTIHYYDYPQAATLRHTRGDQTQVLNLNVRYYEIFLEGYGDFDGDGFRDYLLGCTSEKQYVTELYLSSAAGPGELLRVVAAEWLSCCC